MPPRLRIPLVLGAFALVVSARSVQAQGLIVDRRPHVPILRTYEVREVTVDARVRDQVAEVQVSQTFHNPGSFEIEAARTPPENLGLEPSASTTAQSRNGARCLFSRHSRSEVVRRRLTSKSRTRSSKSSGRVEWARSTRPSIRSSASAPPSR